MDFAVKRLPIGIEFFDEMIKNQYYYVDKTGMISELLRSGGKVTLFTRPRRFGKSLNMSMLKNFFSLQGDKRIFNELQISRDKQVCEEYMGKFPKTGATSDDQIDAISGATITTNAMTNGVNAGLCAFRYVEGGAES